MEQTPNELHLLTGATVEQYIGLVAELKQLSSTTSSELFFTDK